MIITSRRPAAVAAWEAIHGKLIYNGAWDLARPGRWADPREVRDLAEGNPRTLPCPEPAPELIARLARAHPGEITLWCAAPLTNVALALRLEPRLPELVRELHLMGGSFAPVTEAREFVQNPRREFNLRFDTEAEAVHMANDTEFGLASYFYTRDLGRMYRVSEALEYGMVGVNVGILATEHVPFGGMKQSGLGREGSRHGMTEYLEMKYVCVGDVLKTGT